MSDAPEPRPTQPPFRWALLAVVLAGLVVVFVLFWFQPQQLFIDERVDEALPGAGPAPRNSSEAGVPAAPGPGEGASTPVELARGSFVSLDHATRGTVRVLAAGEMRIVRLEGFETENGPDLYVYLTTTPSDGEEATFDDEFVNLGRLKGNQGDQNYELTSESDLSRFQTVVIWCDRFNSAFGAADLSAG